MIEFSQRRVVWLTLILGVALLSAGWGSLRGITLTARAETDTVNWPQIKLTRVVTGLVQPTSITNAADGSGRLLVTEKTGRVRIVQSGVLSPTSFLDISSEVATRGEQGINSVAFPSDYASKKYFYVDYAALNSHAIVSRFQLTADPNVADAASEQIVLNVKHPNTPSHYSGQLAFGPTDGFLYVGVGDGGCCDDLDNNAQNHGLLLGKLLRIDTETGSPVTYTIPASNPYTNTAGYRPEIWALGLRNPWRFSFDAAGNKLYIADVGENAEEEIDVQSLSSPGGRNYGWHILEGNQCHTPPSGCVAPPRYSAPKVIYPHGTNDSIGCAVVGGYVYRGATNPNMDGFYFYGDHCSGNVWAAVKHKGVWKSKLLLTTRFELSTFGLDEAGELYLAGYDNGMIYHVEQAP